MLIQYLKALSLLSLFMAFFFASVLHVFFAQGIAHHEFAWYALWIAPVLWLHDYVTGDTFWRGILIVCLSTATFGCMFCDIVFDFNDPFGILHNKYLTTTLIHSTVAAFSFYIVFIGNSIIERRRTTDVAPGLFTKCEEANQRGQD